MSPITALQEESLLGLQRDLGTCEEGQSNRENHNTPGRAPSQPSPIRPSGHRIEWKGSGGLSSESGHTWAFSLHPDHDLWGCLGLVLWLVLVREAGLVHRWSFWLHAILLLAPGYLTSKCVAGPTAGAWATWGAGIGDTGSDGPVTRVGRGTRVAGQPRTQN